MPVRGIRGATVVDNDFPREIILATKELLLAILDANPTLQTTDLASALFTVSDDLQSAYPAQAARDLGWREVPLMCAREIPVPGGLAGCIRVLLHWNTDITQDAVRHVYLGAAASLRSDLSTE